MNVEKSHTRARVATPLTLVLAGGLCLHGEVGADVVAERAHAMGLDTGAAARAVHLLIAEGLVSVQRDGSGGKLIATPALADMSQARRIRGVVAWLALGGDRPQAPGEVAGHA
jgi:hypothetical protein